MSLPRILTLLLLFIFSVLAQQPVAPGPDPVVPPPAAPPPAPSAPAPAPVPPAPAPAPSSAPPPAAPSSPAAPAPAPSSQQAPPAPSSVAQVQPSAPPAEEDTTTAQAGATTVITATSSTSARSTSRSPTPQNTYYASFSYTGTIASQTQAPGSVVSAPPLSSNASSRGFWSNKGAVGATFTFLSLLGIGIVATVFVVMRKRRRRARRRRQRYLEKYNAAQARQQAANDASTDGHFEESEPSISHATAVAPTNAYPDRQVHYGATQMSQVDQGGYDGNGVGYILGSDYTQDVNETPATAQYYQTGAAYAAGYGQPAYQQQQAYQHTAYQQHDAYPGYGQATQYSSPQQTQAAYSSQHYSYAQPNKTQFSGQAPPVTSRQPGARGNGYDHPIDSFYGAPGANGHATHAV